MTDIDHCPLCNHLAALDDNGFCWKCNHIAARDLTTPQIMLEKRIERENKRKGDIRNGGDEPKNVDGLGEPPKHLKLTKKGRLEYLEHHGAEIIESYPEKYQ